MTEGALWFFVYERLPEFWLRTGEHIMLTGLSTGIAIILGHPMGILASRVSWLRGPLLGATGILQTIPSLAMLAILLAVTGRIGVVPAIIALALYALLPIVRNTLTGIEGVPPEGLEAGRGIGMTNFQLLWMVKIPLALPVIIAGIRTAAVTGVGIATLSAFIGAGGLGQFINRGLALSNNRLILLGAIPAALLALLVDFSIAAVVWALQPRRHRHLGPRKRILLRTSAFLLPVILALVGFLAYHSDNPLTPVSATGPAQEEQVPGPQVVVGSKNFTEQLILGELMSQCIEGNTHLRVVRRFNLGGTMICHGALLNGGIDLYPEYTGTGLTVILGKKGGADPDKVLTLVRRAYLDRFGISWLAPFGFNNTYALTVREKDARKYGWRFISDLKSTASGLRAGFTSEFAERPDGYPGLQKAYGFRFGEVKDLDPTIMYEALLNGGVDIICAFATDGRIAAYNLKPLIDDLEFFPPYYGAPVVRKETLAIHPEIREALGLLTGRLDNAAMQELNYEVDSHKRSPREVAREFLRDQGILGRSAERGGG